MTRRTAKKATASSARAKKNPQRDSDSGSEWSDDEARRPSRAARAGAAGKKAGTRSGASQASATQRTRRGRSQLVEAEQAEAGVPQAAPSAADATEPAPGDKKPDDPFAFDGGDDNEKDKVQWTPEPPKTGKRVKLWKTQQKKQPTRPVSPTRVFRRPGVVQKKEDDVKESPMAINALLNPIEGPPTDEPPAGPPLLELPDVPFASKRERKKTLPLPQPPEPNPHYDEPAPRRREAAPTTRPDRARRHTKVISYEESQDSQTLLPPPKKTGQRGRKKSSAGDGIRSEEPAEKQSPAETKAGNKRKLPKEESDSLPTKRTKSGEEIVSERDVP